MPVTAPERSKADCRLSGRPPSWALEARPDMHRGWARVALPYRWHSTSESLVVLNTKGWNLRMSLLMLALTAPFWTQLCRSQLAHIIPWNRSTGHS